MHWKSTERSITTTVRPSKALKLGSGGAPDPSSTSPISQHHPGNCACLPQPYHMYQRFFLQSRAVVKDLNIDRVLSNRIKEKRTAASYCISILSSSFTQEQQESFSTMTSPHEPTAG